MLLMSAAARSRALVHAVTRAVQAAASRSGRPALAGLLAVLGALSMTAPALAGAGGHHHGSYRFATVDNNGDPTFNQLLGINNHNLIAGYFGSGAEGHPNQGYLLFGAARHTYFAPENVPGAVQTQVTGLNDRGITVGFWSDMNNADLANDNFGFYSRDGRLFTSVNFPTTDNATPAVNQLLGVNDRNRAVGFYVDSMGNSHGYTYDIGDRDFNPVTVPGAVSTTAAAINNRGDIAGFETDGGGAVHAFLLGGRGGLTTLDYPGASMTQAFGVNNRDEVVGDYQVGSGDTATMHGFTWSPWRGFASVDDPNGVGTTTINGVNDHGDLVGFYTDGAGNTDGMVAFHRR